jgi:hypothetical protein
MESYDTWIANLMNGRQSAEDQAARAKFRATQAAPAAAPVRTRPAEIHTAGQNAWGVEDRCDGLAQYTLLDGPGRFANCISK